MLNQRSSGILLHPTSLPSRFGIGDLGEEAYHFIDFLRQSHQRIWQILPLGPTGYGNSPYLCYSALALNPLLISPDKLVEAELIPASALDDLPTLNPERVDFEAVKSLKANLFQQAWTTFQQEDLPELKADFVAFIEQQADWLTDYALFMALKEHHLGAS